MVTGETTVTVMKEVTVCLHSDSGESGCQPIILHFLFHEPNEAIAKLVIWVHMYLHVFIYLPIFLFPHN